MDNIKLLSPKPGVNLCAVKVPEGYKNYFIQYIDERYRLELFNEDCEFLDSICLPKVAWQELGISDQLTEEQCKELVPERSKFLNDKYRWPEYVNHGYSEIVSYMETAKESFASFLQSEEICSVNPYAGIFTPRVSDTNTKDLGEIIADVIYNDMKELFLKAEVNTGRWLILKH